MDGGAEGGNDTVGSVAVCVFFLFFRLVLFPFFFISDWLLSRRFFSSWDDCFFYFSLHLLHIFCVRLNDFLWGDCGYLPLGSFAFDEIPMIFFPLLLFGEAAFLLAIMRE